MGTEAMQTPTFSYSTTVTLSIALHEIMSELMGNYMMSGVLTTTLQKYQISLMLSFIVFRSISTFFA